MGVSAFYANVSIAQIVIRTVRECYVAHRNSEGGVTVFDGCIILSLRLSIGVPKEQLADGKQLQLERVHENNHGANQGRSNISTGELVEVRFKDMTHLLGTFDSRGGGETWADLLYMNFMQSMGEHSIRPTVWGRLLSVTLRVRRGTQQCLIKTRIG